MCFRYTTNTIAPDNAPARTRTRNSSLGPRRDRPLHHQGARAEGKGFEPSFHKRETALAVRPGQPYPATFLERSMTEAVDHRGVEPRFPGCKPGVVPLDQQPIPDRIVPEGVEPPFPLCKRGVVAIGPRDAKAEHRPTRMSQAPVSSRASRPYESRSDTCHAWVNQAAPRGIEPPSSP
jgi:hypothetical protein